MVLKTGRWRALLQDYPIQQSKDVLVGVDGGTDE
jgi:hypothetical protein